MTYTNTPIDTTFSHTYELDVVSDAPISSPRHYYYPGASTEGGMDGILVEVRPKHCEPWFGTFAFGHVAPRGKSGIFTMPNPDVLCVVSRGEGYLVSASLPKSWERLRVVPVIDVRPVLAYDIIVFAEFTRLVAFGREGIKWQTKRLSWDNLQISEVATSYIKGEFWDVRSDAIASFVVDLATGTHQGGVDDI